MIGPTHGVGKTEIARRLARLADAPFIKIEATKFTEVGYVGRDVDTIIRDLAWKLPSRATGSALMRQVRARAEDATEERILDTLLPSARSAGFLPSGSQPEDGGTRQKFRKKLREGELEPGNRNRDLHAFLASWGIFAPLGMERS